MMDGADELFDADRVPTPSTRLLRGGADEEGGFPGTEWVKWLAAAVGVLFATCILMHCWLERRDRAARAIHLAEFEKAVADAREKQTSNGARDEETHTSLRTYNGEFVMKYRALGKELSRCSKIRLRRKSDRSGYTIAGDCKGASWITTRITDGCVGVDGAAWWVEETVPKSHKWRGLNEGTFDFARNTFTGTWRASNGFRGRQVTMQGKNISTTCDPVVATPVGPRTLADTLRDNVPVAVAMLVS